MERLTSKRDWIEAGKDLSNEYGYSHIWRRLKQIEDILGDTYDLDRLRELVEADTAGRALIVTDEMAAAMMAGSFVMNKNGVEDLAGVGLNWLVRKDKALYIPYRKAADMLREAAEAALAKEAEIK